MMTATTTRLIRVMLVEDDKLTCLGLRTQLGKYPDSLRVVGEADNGKDALALAKREQPDIILLDLNLGHESGLDLLGDFKSVAPQARTIVVTAVLDFEAHQLAISKGAKGLVLKKHALENIVAAVRQVYRGEVWYNREMMWKVIEKMAERSAPKKADPETSKIQSLTQREREVISLVGEGLKNRGIADRLHITETTVRHHLTKTFDKLDVKDRLELVIYAYKYGLATLPK